MYPAFVLTLSALAFCGLSVIAIWLLGSGSLFGMRLRVSAIPFVATSLVIGMLISVCLLLGPISALLAGIGMIDWLICRGVVGLLTLTVYFGGMIVSLAMLFLLFAEWRSEVRKRGILPQDFLVVISVAVISYMLYDLRELFSDYSLRSLGSVGIFLQELRQHAALERMVVVLSATALLLVLIFLKYRIRLRNWALTFGHLQSLRAIKSA